MDLQEREVQGEDSCVGVRKGRQGSGAEITEGCRGGFATGCTGAQSTADG